MATDISRPDPTTARPAPKVTVDDRVRIGLSTLPPAQRERVEAALTWHELCRLAESADRAGVNGRLRVADVTHELRVIFRITPGGAEVTDLISKRAFDQLFPVTPAARKMKTKSGPAAKLRVKSPRRETPS